MAANLAKHGSVHELARLSNVDRVDDLAVLKDELTAVPNLSVEQWAVLNWAISAMSAIA